MTSLLEKLSAITGEAFVAEDLPAEMGLVRVSDRPDLAQFQCNGAMAAAKAARTNPRAVAEAVLARLKDNPVFSKIEIAGPGFINLNVTDEMLAKSLTEIATDQRCGVADTGQGATVVVDYGGPNVAKAMHVGHLRPAIIGESIKRIIGFAGYNPLGDVHMGDWGLPMGQIISELEIRHPDWPYFDIDFTGPYPAQAPFDYAELEQIYPFASQACKDDPARREIARKATVDLQDGRRGYRALWAHFMTLSKADMKHNYDSLNIHFEIWKGEADVHNLIPEVAADLKQKGLAVMSDGALVVPVVEEGDNKEMPPLIFTKSDGGATYGTTDLTTLYERKMLYADLAAIVYVIDKRQNLHCEQVFRAAHKADYVGKTALSCIGFGTLNGPDNKPFKTRDGGVMKFSDMVGQAMEKARQRLAEAELGQGLSETEKADIASKVAIAAIKFADLQNQTHIDYIFDLDRMSSFEGKTGPYMLYQAVRIKSLLRKAEAQGEARGTAIILQDAERPLALMLTELPEVFGLTLRHYTPHVLCDYAYRLANAFSSFYGNCHILSEPDVRVKESRLLLCRMVLTQLELVLDLLGIAVPERM